MRTIMIGLLILVQGHMAVAASMESLLQAAGLTPFTQPGPAVDFELSDLSGQMQRLSEQRGKVVFLNFWATWCPPCRREMPEMETLFQSFRQQPFVMWAVAMQETREEVAAFFEENELHFPALLDLDGEVSGQYAIQGLPTTYMIDCSGKTVGRAIGPREWNDDKVRTLLRALLSDKQCH